MKNLILKRIIGLCMIVKVLILSISCEKYLNVQSNDRLVVPGDLESFQKLLDNSAIMNFKICGFGEVSSDDYYIIDQTFNTFNFVQQNAYIWNNYDYNYPNDWGNAYEPVYVSNLILERIQKVERNGQNRDQWDEVYGAALFFRANQYLSLLWTFAKAYDPSSAKDDLGIILRQSADLNEKSVRSSVEEGYNKVISDIRIAAEKLPETSTHVMRPNRLTAHGLLARAYLSIAKYDSAYYYADLTLKTKHELLDFNNPNDVVIASNFPFGQFNKETIFYNELITQVPLLVNNARIDTALYASYSDDDLRKAAYFNANTNGRIAFKGSHTGSQTLFGGLTVAEMYLIRAECLARRGMDAEALQDLNTVLQSRYRSSTFFPYNSSDVQEVIRLILIERRKELVFRGLRWIDIKRLNLEGYEIELKRLINGQEHVLIPNENRFALPLPMDIIQQTGIPQNPE